MEDKFNEIKNKIEKLIEKLENKSLYGPIAYLEEAMENISNALEEYTTDYSEE